MTARIGYIISAFLVMTCLCLSAFGEAINRRTRKHFYNGHFVAKSVEKDPSGGNALRNYIEGIIDVLTVERPKFVTRNFTNRSIDDVIRMVIRYYSIRPHKLDVPIVETILEEWIYE